MTTKERRVAIACDICRGSSKPGYLWLGGSDYVECPQCFASAKVDVVEHLTVPGTIFRSLGIPSR